MNIFIGADHRGFKLKEFIKKELLLSGFNINDQGAHILDPNDDDVDYAQLVARKVIKNKNNRGILICGSGHGVDMVANRFKGIRCILGFNLDVVVMGREHEDANIISLPAQWVTSKNALKMVKTFLTTKFSNKARYIRRLKKLNSI